jgi:hypothetical protein
VAIHLRPKNFGEWPEFAMLGSISYSKHIISACYTQICQPAKKWKNKWSLYTDLVMLCKFRHRLRCEALHWIWEKGHSNSFLTFGRVPDPWDKLLLLCLRISVSNTPLKPEMKSTP